jgi:hypothetical protein
MSSHRRFIAVDEEHGKKDDDHRQGVSSVTNSSRTAYNSFPLRGPRRNRFLIALFVFGILYLFVKNIPADSDAAIRRQPSRFSQPASSSQSTSAPKGAPPKPDVENADSRHYYEGRIKFHRLVHSLGTTVGTGQDTQNVLFVVSNLKSASSLLPLACDMSVQNRNRVHVMLTGRDELTIDDFKNINHISEDDCSVKWHDGRPEFASYSTEYRMEMSVRASLYHLTSRMKPMVVMTDSPEREDAFFIRGIRQKTRDLNLPLIELPINAAQKLRWISKLDASALMRWHDVNVEILVHAPPLSSGSLIRLLRSLESADYFGFPHPRLTIELPNDVDPPTLDYLSKLHWPPFSSGGNSRLTLRRRILSNQVTSAAASVRQIESIYPSDPAHSHVLVLSPQAELSPLYFQFLIYTVLEYKYSKAALNRPDSLLGVSLERPKNTLDDKRPLTLPDDDPYTSSLFLYQAPNSNAALYFGERWVELHSFLSNRLAVPQPGQTPAGDDSDGQLPKSSPPWLGYILELARIRGYSMLYPSLGSGGAYSDLATMHSEAYHPPDPDRSSSSTSSTASLTPEPFLPNEPLLAPPDIESPTSVPDSLDAQDPYPPSQPPRLPLHHLPPLSSLPILSYTGSHLPQGLVSLNQAALLYAYKFVRDGGPSGCRESSEGTAGGDSRRPARTHLSADDLFCRGEVEDKGEKKGEKQAATVEARGVGGAEEEREEAAEEEEEEDSEGKEEEEAEEVVEKEEDVEDNEVVEKKKE